MDATPKIDGSTVLPGERRAQRSPKVSAATGIAHRAPARARITCFILMRQDCQPTMAAIWLGGILFVDPARAMDKPVTVAKLAHVFFQMNNATVLIGLIDQHVAYLLDLGLEAAD